jgi:signal transduction histidine kinase
MRRRPALLLSLAAIAATGVVAFAPGIHFAYRSPAGHAAIETAATLIGCLAAYLLLARFRLGRAAPDLWLACALWILASSNLLFAVIPALAASPAGSMLSWARVFSDVIGIGLFAVAAWIPLRTARAPVRSERIGLVVAAAVIVFSFLAAAALNGLLPTPIDPTLSPESSMRPRIAGAALVEVAQLLGACAFFVAGIAFARRAKTEGDPFFRWLSVAAAFGCVARVHYFLFPSLYSPWVHTGDILRLCYHLIILAASVREIASYQPRLAEAAILDERRRIARDLHDGLAQELAFIASGLRSFDDQPPTAADVEQLLDAADQALLESRQAISALAADPAEPLGAAVSRVASALALRSGARVSLDIEEDAEARPAVREAVLRITREAMTNALRHGLAREVNVALSTNGAVRLAIHDDGAGFTLPAESAGIGLQSMRERAEGVGGQLQVHSALGTGTTVEALLPR